METPKKETGGVQTHSESPFSDIADELLGPSPDSSRQRSGWLGQWSAGTLWLAAVAFAALVLIGFGLFWLQTPGRKPAVTNAMVQGVTVPVNALIEGKIVSMAVSEGDFVKAGALIAQLQNSEHKARVAEIQEQVRKAEAQKGKAEKGLDDLRRRVPVEMNQATRAVEASRARLKAAEAGMRRDLTERDRDHVVYRSGPAHVRRKQEKELSRTAAKDELLTARRELQRNEERLRTVMAKHNLMETKLRSLAGAKVRLDRSQSSLDKARNDLAATNIASPISGFVYKRVVRDGDVVKLGEPVAIVVDSSRLWLEASVTEEHRKTMGIGQTVDIRFDAYPEKISKGTIVGLGPETTMAAGAPAESPPVVGQGRSTADVPLKVEVPHFDQQLRPGMKASIIIDPGKH